jgi:hypothetical protein
MFRELENLNFVIVSDFVLRILHVDISIRMINFGVIFINYSCDVILEPDLGFSDQERPTNRISPSLRV